MDPYIGEIRIFAGNFAPRGWAFCDGSLIPINQNTPLFSILGVQYGGDGKNTFALPNFQGAAPIHQGEGPGLTPRRVGEIGGTATVTLLQTQIPSHNHVANAQLAPTGAEPTQAVWASSAAGRGQAIYSSNTDTPLNPTALGVTGGSQPHNNMQPYLAMNFIIALEGVYPQRS